MGNKHDVGGSHFLGGLNAEECKHVSRAPTQTPASGSEKQRFINPYDQEGDDYRGGISSLLDLEKKISELSQ